MRARPYFAIKLLLFALLVNGICIFGAVAAQEIIERDPAEYGAESNPTGSPIGGGSGYRQIFTTGDYIVSTADELLSALANARSGEVVYVVPEAEIDLTGKVGISIKAGVTLAGNRGFNDSPGPLIYCNEYDTYGLFTLLGEKSRITGIRLRGPDPDILGSAYERPNSKAIAVYGNDAEIDNNEIYNWSYAGVSIEKHARIVHVHHNYIHHVRRAGLGYPVVVNQGYALIEGNTFDYYRHAIAATGYIGSAYEARYNLVLENATSHAFDMHGGADFCPKRTAPCTATEAVMGGEYVIIHHNTFRVTSARAIVLRGIPRETTQIHHNWFYSPVVANGVAFVNYSGGNVSVYENAYGLNKDIQAVQYKPSPFVHRGQSQNDPIVATTDGFKPIRFNVISPEAIRVAGTVPLVIDTDITDVIGDLEVEIKVDQHTIYSGLDIPPPGQISIDTLQLNDGQHLLDIRITDTAGRTANQTVRFGVYNWWRLNDPLLGPLNSSFFGVVDRSVTLDTSAGWQYATDRVSDFFDDDSRCVPQTDGVWLTWETPYLAETIATVYSRDPDNPGITLTGSPDLVAWQNLVTIYTRSATPSAGGWYQYQVVGVVPHGSTAHYVKLQVDDGFAGKIQIGQVNSIGRNLSQ
ncbi:MAG TPA: hypothetical protein GXZ82_01835 [Firmicutes bacterium]|jgi:hypothetical protein|nr:hypothetical protein [Bacillota bacterium]